MPEFLEFKPELVKDEGTNDSFDSLIIKQDVQSIRANITAREWGIVQQRYIADLGLKEIAEFEGISLQRVDEILKSVKRNVRNKVR